MVVYRTEASVSGVGLAFGGRFLRTYLSWCLLPISSFCLAACGMTPQPTGTIRVSPEVAYVGAGQSIQLMASTGNGMPVEWTVEGNGAVGSVASTGLYTAPSAPGQITVVKVRAEDSAAPAIKGLALLVLIPAAAVSPTANPQVARYTIEVPEGLSAFVEFGAGTSYELRTSARPAPAGGGLVRILVAGMTGNSLYHMRAVFHLTGGTDVLFRDSEHMFMTGSYPAGSFPSFVAGTTPGQTPQPGVELLDLLNGTGSTRFSAVVTDLSGNVLWAYDPGTSVPATNAINPIKLLRNGRFLINFSGVSASGVDSVLQEVDLSGKVIWQMRAADLNAALAAATCSGCNISVIGTHHDFALLPSGHLLLLAAEQRTINGTVVVGDVVIDLDPNRRPVWIWNAFDHLDINRHPAGPLDWTHSNSVMYSSHDKSIIVSMRNQSWVLKINYKDGAGDGSVIWRLGYQGDFRLEPGTAGETAPIDWFYAQHDANIVSPAGASALQLLLFDNGDFRVLDSSGTICGAVPCYSRVPILQLDETAMTATTLWVNNLSPIYSFFGGSARMLKNENIEFDECALFSRLPALEADIYEVVPTSPPQTVWHMQISGDYAYRGVRIPSLYPGVQW